MLFGQSTLMSLPASDDAAREHWFNVLQQHSTNVFVLLTNQPISMSLFFVAPTATVATNLVHDLNDYFRVSGSAPLQAPWTAAAQKPEFQKARTARRNWTQLEEELTGVYKDPALRAFSRRIMAEMRKGATAEVQRLNQEQAAKAIELKEQVRAKFRSQPDSIDPKLLELNKKWSELSYTNRIERVRLGQELAEHLGPVPRKDGQADPAELALGARYGTVLPHGLLIEVTWATLSDPTVGLPPLLQWLCQNQCATFKYDFYGGAAYAEEEEQ
jgi:hypothetical protein